MYIVLFVLLVSASITDLVRNKIPNVISLTGIVAGLIGQWWFAGLSGAFDGLLGLLVGLLCFFPFYTLRAMAAGDVKLMAMVGVFVGPKVAIACVASALISGMVLALGYTIVWGKNTKLLQRYGLMIKTFLRTFRWVYIRPTEDDAGAMRFPYALAILTGTAIGLWFSNVSVMTLGV